MKKLLLLAAGGYLLWKILGEKKIEVLPSGPPPTGGLGPVPGYKPGDWRPPPPAPPPDYTSGKGDSIEDAWLAWQVKNPGGTREEFTEECLVMR